MLLDIFIETDMKYLPFQESKSSQYFKIVYKYRMQEMIYYLFLASKKFWSLKIY